MGTGPQVDRLVEGARRSERGRLDAGQDLVLLGAGRRRDIGPFLVAEVARVTAAEDLDVEARPLPVTGGRIPRARGKGVTRRADADQRLARVEVAADQG